VGPGGLSFSEPGARRTGLDEEAAAALARSRIGDLAPATLARLFEDAADIVVPAGGVIDPAGEAPYVHLVVRGIVRLVALSPDGRRATIRYARDGDMIGVASLFSARSGVTATIALRQSRILMLRPGIVRGLAATDVQVAGALLAELSDRVIGHISELVGSSFSGLRQKVGRHLLDIATVDAEDGRFVARISQAELADAVGTSREVVVRVLHDLRAAGLVKTSRHGISILEAERLHDQTWPRSPRGT
jgi:CRP/FNR family cyclic AMP-dependent transcriptional regulator